MPKKQSRDEKGIIGAIMIVSLMVIALVMGFIGYQQYKATLTTTTTMPPGTQTSPTPTPSPRTSPPGTNTTTGELNVTTIPLGNTS